MSLLDLPVDVLFLVFPYLDVPSFVSLTSTCKSLHDPSLSQDSQYWSSITRSTFRIPNQPVVEHDGRRWRKLYQRLLTQSRVYTWGSNAKANLGHSYESFDTLQRLPPARRRRHAIRARNVSWPTEMEGYQELGIISDLQSGGWSTTLLTSKGALYSVGVLDGLQFNQRQPPYMQTIKPKPTRLQYPPGYTPPDERYDPVTAVKQFSSGRAHILGLSDNGRIWSWNNIDQAALNVKFLDIDLTEGNNASGKSKVKKVVAGWNKSAALVSGVGIVLWDTLSRARDEPEIEDAALVLQSAIVPETEFERQSSGSGQASYTPTDSGTSRVGEVMNFILLEHFVLFNTHTGQVYVAEIIWNDAIQDVGQLIEIPLTVDTAAEESKPQEGIFATDVQGSFSNFAIFAKGGIVFNGNAEYLGNLLSHTNSPSIPLEKSLMRIPALQHKDVIALTFGDYHFQALHSSGRITSYGTECQGCGSFGLGGSGVPEGRLRGIRYAGVGGDGRLVPHAYTTGRQVWFEHEKRDWIRFLVSGGTDPEEGMERIRMCAETAVQGEVSEWIEQEGRAWDDKFGLRGGADDSDDQLGAYFALSVTAAGWHSGALVLVNEDMAAKIRERCTVPIQPNAESQEETEAPDYVASTITWTLDTVRWLLGFAPASASQNTDSINDADNDRNSAPISPQNPEHFTNPVNHGAALDEHTQYRWADDSFPRLRLADGREMPGRVEFSEWRNGRPEWDLSFTGYQ